MKLIRAIFRDVGRENTSLPLSPSPRAPNL